MASIFKWPFKKKRDLLHTCVLILLIGISVYSIYSVFDSYLFDNTSTSASVVMCSNILPFAKYLTMRYHFSNYTVFPETWKLNVSGQYKLLPQNYEKPRAWPLARRIEERKSEKIFNPEHLPTESLSLENMIDVACITGMLNRLDYEFLAGITQDKMSGQHSFTDPRTIGMFFLNLSAGVTAYASGSFYSVPTGPIKPEVTTVVDAFIENRFADALIDATISHILGLNPVRLLTAPFANAMSYVPVSIFVDWLSPHSLQMSIPLDFVGDIAAQTITLAILPFDNTAGEPPSFSEVSYYFAPYDAPGRVAAATYRKNLERFKPITLSHLQLLNSAVYISTGVRSESDCRVCGNLSTIEHCKFKCLVDSVVDLCRCVPFTFRRLYYSDMQRQKFPRCTMKRYAMCLQSTTYDPRHCAGGTAAPCVTVQNTVSLQTSSFNSTLDLQLMMKAKDPDYVSVNQTYQHYIRIITPQKTYVTFEDKFQNTWMQMLGEVGGNLGIFLAFSLYGVWQVAAFCYIAYERHRDRDSLAFSINSVQGILTPWLRLAQLNTEAQAATHGGGGSTSINTEQRQLEDILSHIRDHDEKFDDIFLQDKSMEKRLQALEARTVNSNVRKKN